MPFSLPTRTEVEPPAGNGTDWLRYLRCRLKVCTPIRPRWASLAVQKWFQKGSSWRAWQPGVEAGLDQLPMAGITHGLGEFLRVVVRPLVSKGAFGRIEKILTVKIGDDWRLI